MDSPGSKPLFIFDGDCSFCRMWVDRLRACTGDALAFEPFQTAAERFPQISREEFNRAVKLIEPDGAIYSAADAYTRALAHSPCGGKSKWVYAHVPGASAAMEFGYRRVANNRGPLYRVCRLLWGRSVEPASFVLSRSIFLRLLGVVYLIAFLSLGSQIQGLNGSNGILPASDLLHRVSARPASDSWALFPTLYRLHPTDGFLDFLAYGGAGLSVLLILGIAPLPTLVPLWAFYLSLSTIGGDFLHFQWEALLLETGALAVFFAPFTLWMRRMKNREPSRAALWLVWLLLFKLMFLSGVVKLTCGDDCWPKLEALKYHYLTQPIPTWTSWYAHHFPLWFQSLSVAVMFGIEIGVPFFIFAPRRLRHMACAALVLLQLLIAGTGNYGFFNLLAIVLCLSLLDDRFLVRFAPGGKRGNVETRKHGNHPPRRETLARRCAVGLIAACVAVINFAFIAEEVPRLEPVANWLGRPNAPGVRVKREADGNTKSERGPLTVVENVVTAIRPFDSINSYGLFRHMTRTRPEIGIEGSMDGVAWRAYEFYYKPGDPMRPPPFIGAHMPRLDWQMWFAALQAQRPPYWFGQFLRRLLEGSPPVLKLLKTNPFPDAPPKYIRAVYYDYTFTTSEERKATGAWWKRSEHGLYAPMLSLRNFKDR